MTKARDLANAADVLDDVSATELSYVNGVTSAIQTQLNAKQAVVSGVDDTEIGYLNGVTSAIQTQIDSKIGSASAISPTLIDAKGDLIVGSAADTAARLAVGTNNYVLTADSAATNGVKWAAPAAGGKVLQVVNATYSTQTSNTSTTFADTGLTATITPSSSTSKVLVIVHQTGISKYNYNTAVQLKLLRGSTDLVTFEKLAAYDDYMTGASENNAAGSGTTYLDSPATTSATTYKTQFCRTNTGGEALVQRSGCTSTITLMEIGA